jgi:beta-lactamase class A
MITRRNLLSLGTLAAAGTLALPRVLRAEHKAGFRSLPAAFAQLEKANAGRLGVAVEDLGSGEKAGYHANDPFAMCSTFKFLLAAAILHRVDTHAEQLDRMVDIPEKPLIANSPLTEERAGKQMKVFDLCGAILTRSDNTAANLLIDSLGGPGGVTVYARSIGDPMTRLDRTETSLNEARPGDPRDTTSPSAMVGNLHRLLLGRVLSPPSRERLTQWMIANTTGDTRIRAKLPEGWRAGDKTGSNGTDTANDIAILWPPHGDPILVAAYLTECPGPEEKRNAVLAEVGRLITASYTPR